MKRKIVSLMLGLAMFGEVAAMAVPNGAQASANECSHSRSSYERTYKEYDNLNPFDHYFWEYDERICHNCGEHFSELVNYGVESHDMKWVDYDMGLLRCDCGQEEYFK